MIRSVIMIAALVSMLAGSAAAAVSPLFVIERSKNANIVVYEAHLTAPGVFAAPPVVAYWKMFTKGGRTEDLLMIEKRAYGFSIRKDGDSYIMNLAPFRTRDIAVVPVEAGARARMAVAGVPSWLTKVYIKAKDGMVLPKVEYIELFGVAVTGGAATYEKIVP